MCKENYAITNVESLTVERIINDMHKRVEFIIEEFNPTHTSGSLIYTSEEVSMNDEGISFESSKGIGKLSFNRKDITNFFYSKESGEFGFISFTLSNGEQWTMLIADEGDASDCYHRKATGGFGCTAVSLVNGELIANERDVKWGISTSVVSISNSTCTTS